MAVLAATRVQNADPADKIVRHAGILFEYLHPLNAQRSLRNFMIHEVSRLASTPESTLKLISNDGKGPVPVRLETNHRVYTLAQIKGRRELFAAHRTAEALRLLPHRRDGEHCRFWPERISRAALLRRRAPTLRTVWRTTVREKGSRCQSVAAIGTDGVSFIFHKVRFPGGQGDAWEISGRIMSEVRRRSS